MKETRKGDNQGTSWQSLDVPHGPSTNDIFFIVFVLNPNLNSIFFLCSIVSQELYGLGVCVVCVCVYIHVCA